MTWYLTKPTTIVTFRLSSSPETQNPSISHYWNYLMQWFHSCILFGSKQWIWTFQVNPENRYSKKWNIYCEAQMNNQDTIEVSLIWQRDYVSIILWHVSFLHWLRSLESHVESTFQQRWNRSSSTVHPTKKCKMLTTINTISRQHNHEESWCWQYDCTKCLQP